MRAYDRASPYANVYYRMRPCLKRIQPMPNVPLSDIFHTLPYASTIRNSMAFISKVDVSSCYDLIVK